MAAEFTPHWVEDLLMRPHGPNSWAFYVVANIHGRRRPLAVVYRDPPAWDTIRIFSDPSNRVAIESEVTLATDFFQDAENVPLPSIELPKDRSFTFCATEYIQLSSDWGMTKFPFISTSLLLGASFGAKFSGGCVAKPWPLGMIYRHNYTQYGIVVIDITDMDSPRYGIIGFMTQIMIWVETDQKWLDDGPVGTREVMVEDDQPCKPLSAAEYMAKFSYKDADGLVLQFEQIPLIDVSAIDYKSDIMLISLLQRLYLLMILKVI
ncbi:hypothetical protein OIDMADRAFT_62143 [Oidiodendron maius Zn]|uniref:Uncharacterized protein n=1 Tax=Oidiodendron maius (strain Zn) TaxID=913774 RepID=A0A0C3CT91_OIDMZ|nr:hypothetical protein OIDMADRAFT_62143 [Oidiodendron maius Zn]